MTASERKRRFSQLAQIGCIVCRTFHDCRTDGNIHHLTGLAYRCMGRKAEDHHTICLCPTHHQYGTKDIPSVHGQPKEFQERYGTQAELLEMTDKLLEGENAQT